MCQFLKCPYSYFFYLKVTSNRPQILFKLGVLKKFLNIHRKTHVLESLFNSFRPATLIKRDSNIGVFLGILQNF